MRIHELFDVAVARSRGTDDYTDGSVPFITNTELNNGVVRYVEPFDDDKVFRGPAICISGLGHATVHFGAFLPKGNGGDSCTVLTPLQSMPNLALLYYAALFNTMHGWRFSFGRKTSKSRLTKLALTPLFDEAPLDIQRVVTQANSSMTNLIEARERAILGLS